MQYALVQDKKLEAFPSGKGTCPICGAAVLAKCGNRIIHHWAHARSQNCDPWWENETTWHREWKDEFPIEWREVSHRAPDGEVHRADVKTANGIVIEFQHSSMNDAERVSREQFYGNLIWVIDGRAFKKNFAICHRLPNPKSQLAQDIIWFPALNGMNGANRGIFWRLSENTGYTKQTRGGVQMHFLDEIRNLVDEQFSGHHQYYWLRPHGTWLDSKCPVYLDFGDEHLIRLETYDEYKLPCAFKVNKTVFLEQVFAARNSQDVATV